MEQSCKRKRQSRVAQSLRSTAACYDEAQRRRAAKQRKTGFHRAKTGKPGKGVSREKGRGFSGSGLCFDMGLRVRRRVPPCSRRPCGAARRVDAACRGRGDVLPGLGGGGHPTGHAGRLQERRAETSAVQAGVPVVRRRMAWAVGARRPGSGRVFPMLPRRLLARHGLRRRRHAAGARRPRRARHRPRPPADIAVRDACGGRAAGRHRQYRANLREEWGWRGYLVPKVASRLRIVPTLLVTGVVWGLWHAPLTALGHNYGMGYPGWPFAGIAAMCLFCIVTGFFLAYVTERTGSCLAAAVGHSTINAMAQAGIIFSATGGNPFVGPGPTGIVGGCAFVVVGRPHAVGPAPAPKRPARCACRKPACPTSRRRPTSRRGATTPAIPPQR